ncbi:MAG: M48 family peptidase [Verrucomicrobia bacterium]|nr:MAG: M48 family peptidase [Verrucomicrobiota bacterium]
MPIFQKDSVQYGDTEINYTVTRSKERNTIGITVCGPMVEVSVPSGMKLATIQPFVVKKGAWIVQKLDHARHQKPIYPSILESGTSIRLLGRQYQLRFLPAVDRRASLDVSARQIQIYLPPGGKTKMGQKLIKALLRKELEKFLPDTLEKYSSILKIPVPSIQVRDLGNRWGSCTSSGKLLFHWLLATQSLDFIDSVVAHEICHLIEPKHSPKFKKMLVKLRLNT